MYFFLQKWEDLSIVLKVKASILQNKKEQFLYVLFFCSSVLLVAFLSFSPCVCSYLLSSSHILLSKSGPYIHPEANNSTGMEATGMGPSNKYHCWLKKIKNKKIIQLQTWEPYISFFFFVYRRRVGGSQFIQSIKNSFCRIPVNSFKTSHDRVLYVAHVHGRISVWQQCCHQHHPIWVH